MPKDNADEMANAVKWEHHDTDEEDGPPDGPPGLPPPSDRSGAPLAGRRSRSSSISGEPITLRRSRSAPQTESPGRGGRRRVAIADAATESPHIATADDAWDDVFKCVKISIRATEHLHRLSQSAADAFEQEREKLQRALETLEQRRRELSS